MLQIYNMDSANAMELTMQWSWTLMSIRMDQSLNRGKSLPARQEDSKLQIVSIGHVLGYGLDTSITIFVSIFFNKYAYEYRN